MASFVEQATLKVNDQSTAQINRINAALKQLRATANSLKSVRIKLDVNDGAIRRATQSMRQLRSAVDGVRNARIRIEANTGSIRMAQSQVKNLSRDIRKMKADAQGVKSVKLNVNSTGIQQASQRLKHLQQTAAHPINVNMNQPRVPAAPRGTRTVGGGGGGAGGAGRGFGRGFVSGLGASSVIGAFGAVSTAGYAAAAALRSVAENAAKRDRAALQANVQASAEQRKVFEEMGKGPPPGAALPLTETERSKLRTSLLGDVQGDERGRAVAAVNIAKTLETQLLPRDFAAQPDKSREDTLKGLREIVQAINLASTDIVDKQGNFSKDGLRALKGIQTARAADPELEAHTIKTTLANLKTAGLTLDSDALARVLINAGSRGVRAANETFRAMRGTSGNLDNKSLNDALADMGFLTDVKRKGKKGDKAIVPGSGTLVGAKLLDVDPAVWFQQYFVPKMNEAIEKTPAALARKEQAKKEGKSAADIEEAGKATNQEQVAFIQKKFAAMSAAGLQGIVDMVTGFDQMNASLTQARLALEQPIADAVAKSWAAQAENVGTAWKDAAGKVGDSFMQAIHAPELLAGLAKAIRDNPEATVAATGVAALGTAAAAAAISVAALGRGAGVQAAAQAAGAAAGGGAQAAGGAAAGGVLARMGYIGIVAAAVAATLSLKGDTPGGYADASPEERARMVALAHAYTELYNSTKRLNDVQEGAAPAGTGGFDKFTPAFVEKGAAEMGALQQKITELKSEIARLSEPGAMATKPPVWLQSALDMAKQKPAVEQSAFPAAGADTKLATLPTDIKSVLDSSATSWANTVSTANNNFNTTFNTLPQKGTEAGTNMGTEAGATLRGAAGGIGQTIGNSAAAAIKAAVGNLNINVNANVTGAKNSSSDKGGTSPD